MSAGHKFDMMDPERVEAWQACINKHFPIEGMDGYLPPWPPLPALVIAGRDVWLSAAVRSFGEQLEGMALQFFSDKMTSSLGLKIELGRPNGVPGMPQCDHRIGPQHLYDLDTIYKWVAGIWNAYSEHYQQFVPPKKEA